MARAIEISLGNEIRGERSSLHSVFERSIF